MDIVTIGYLKKYIKKCLIGLGMLRGSPCTVQSVTANKQSSLDPTLVTSHTVTLKYEGNPGQAAALSVTPTFETKAFTIKDGKNIHSIVYNSRDTDYFYYDVTFTDSTTTEMKIPRVVETTQMIVVKGVLPPVDTARQDAIYLLQEDVKKDVYIKYIKVLNEAGTGFQWLSLGTTQIDLSAYQKKIDDAIIKSYKNYDPTTYDAKPTAKNVVGAINTFEKEIGATYNDTTGKITNLNTLHTDTIVNAVNEIGYLPDLQMYDTATGTPDNLVDAINLANKDYEIKQNVSVDRTKYIDTYKLNKDSKDGSAVAQAGDTVMIPRVEITQNTTPDTNDFRTYKMSMAGETKDPNDTTNKPYGYVHIPSIKLARIDPVTDPSLAAQYFLSIEGATVYDEAVAGCKIQLQKDLIIKDAGVKECVVAGVPLATLAVGDKYMYLEFEKPDGSSIFAYIDCKDLLVDNIGEKAIKIEYDSTQKKNVIKLIIHDPDSNEALVQTTNGLRIMNASESQYGVVEYAKKDEVLSPSAATDKTVKPINIYEFVTQSVSVEDDLGNIYEDADGNKPNNTITKSISELASAKLEKRSTSVTDEKNISEYQYETIPATGVKRQLGDAIEVPKTIFQVDYISDITDPKQYFLYYLKQSESSYRAGLYEYYDSEWHMVGGSSIEWVEELPDAYDENHFYAVRNTDVLAGQYSLSKEAVDQGYAINSDGLTDPSGNAYTWSEVTANWQATYKDNQFVQTDHGSVSYVTHGDGTKQVMYDYHNFDAQIWFNVDDTWYKTYLPDVITRDQIYELDIQD